MKNIIRIVVIAIITITTASAAVRLNLGSPVEYRTEKKGDAEYLYKTVEGEAVVTYILNKPEILKKELRNHGYKILDKFDIGFILACLALIIIIFIAMTINFLGIGVKKK